MKYKCKNCGRGDLAIETDKGEPVLVRPGEEIILKRRVETNGMKVIEEIPEPVEKRKKSTKEENKYDS